MAKKKAVGLLVAAGGVYILREVAHRLGASSDEVGRSYPGDDLISRATAETTHAVTVHAPAEAIWPWLVQAGYHRGGWYGNATIDQFFDKVLWQTIVPPEERSEYRPSADRILPEYQDLKVGDIVPDGPPDTVYFIVKEMKPKEHLILFSNTHNRYSVPAFLRGTNLAPYGDFTWAFILNEVDPGKTRLILRTRFKHGPLWFRILGWPILMMGEALFPIQILKGIKHRAEHTISASPGN